MAAADSSRFGDPRSGYAQHPPPPPPSLPHPYAHHHHQHHQSIVPGAAAAAVPAGIPQQSPAYPPPPQQQPQHSIPPHHHQAPPPHPQYGQQQQQQHPLPTASATTNQSGHLDGPVGAGGAAVPNGRFLPGPAEAPMDSGGGGPSLVHPSYGGMPQPHQQHQHHPQHPHHQQFYGQPQHPSQQQQQHHHHPQHSHHHHSSGMGHAMGDVAGGAGMPGGAGAGAPGSHSQQMAPLLPPPALAGGAGVYVPAPPPVTFSAEPQLDFTHILRLFNMTITASPLTTTQDGANDIDPSSRGKKLASLPPSTWNSMLQSAIDGLRSLDPMLADKYVAAAREIQVPEVAEVVVGPDAGGGSAVNGDHHGVNGNGVGDGGAGYGDEEGPDGKKRRQDDKGSEPQECLTCHAKSSPEWRRGPFGPRTLCNACGLVYIKIMKRRAKGLPDEEDENGDGGDDNDGSGSDD